MTDWHDNGSDQGMYLENVMEHYQTPRNRRPLPEATFSHHEYSLSCGDDLTVAVRLGDDGRVIETAFEGTGCALSVASVSMLTDFVRGKTLAELQALSDRDIFALLGFDVGISRLRCATLGLKTLQLGVSKHLGETVGQLPTSPDSE
jgi:NifU-like protein involved in Fe-S cluster formation